MLFIVPVGLTACLFLVPSALQAQEAEYPSNAETFPGQIVYSRDVPFGMATRRFSQGEASTVAPDQSLLITTSLNLGLEPLSDAEQSMVSAPMTQSLNIGIDAINVGLSALSSAKGNTDFTRSENGGSLTGNAVGQALSVLPSALSVIGKSLGNGQ